MRSNWSYEDVESKVWKLPQLTDFFGALDVALKNDCKRSGSSIAELAPGSPRSLKERIRGHGPSTVVPFSWH